MTQTNPTDDLNAAIGRLQAERDLVVSGIAQLVSANATLQAEVAAGNPTAIEAAAQSVDAVTTSLTTAVGTIPTASVASPSA